MFTNMLAVYKLMVEEVCWRCTNVIDIVLLFLDMLFILFLLFYLLLEIRPHSVQMKFRCNLLQ